MVNGKGYKVNVVLMVKGLTPGVFDAFPVKTIPLSDILTDSKVLDDIADLLQRFEKMNAEGAFTLSSKVIDKEKLSRVIVEDKKQIESLAEDLGMEPVQVIDMLSNHRDVIISPVLDVEYVNGRPYFEINIWE